MKILVHPCLFCIVSSLPLAAARAQSDSEALKHPLLSATGRAAIASLDTADALAVLRELTVGGMLVDLGDGPVHYDHVQRRSIVVDAHDYPQRSAPSPHGPTITDALYEEVATNNSIAMVEASMCLRRVDWKTQVSAWHDVSIALVGGGVQTMGDVRAIQVDWRQGVEHSGAGAIDAFLSEWGGFYVEELARWDLSGCFEVSAPVGTLALMFDSPSLTSMDVRHPLEYSDAGHTYTVTGNSIDGRELEDLLQSSPFYTDGYGGNERIGLIDGNNLYRQHVGFNDGSGLSRLENCGAPDVSGNCTTNPNPTIGTAHGTATASIALGDLTAGQDSSFTLLPDQQDRSGVARNATGLAISTSSWADVIPAAADIYLSGRPGGGPPDNECLGNSGDAVKLNSLFESGVFQVWSAGNTGHSTGTCRVRPAQSAIGALTVGASIVDTTDTETIYSLSARGGGGCGDCIGDAIATNDDSRTIVDIMAPSAYEHGYPHYDTTTCSTPFDYRLDWSDDCVDDNYCCTSSAASAALGAAALYREWWWDDISSSILQPERMFTQLLLMGDRQGEAGLLTSGFDVLWGAGNLRLRKLDADGNDAPSFLGWGNTCVDHNSDVVVDLTGPSATVVPADADIIKFVAWWYDTRHDSGTEHDKVDLNVEWDDSGTWTQAGSSTTDDNRQRVFIDSPNNADYRAVLTGRNVTTTMQGCGDDSMRVWYAWLIEDGDRDDGPGSDEPTYARPE